MNYISLEALQHAAALMQSMRQAQQNPTIPDEVKQNIRLICEYGTDDPEAWDDFPPCKNAPAYVIPDATHLSAGGSIEQRAAFFCREHTWELVGEEPQEQPVFRRILPPDET